MRHAALRLPRASGPLAVALLSLLVTSGGSPAPRYESEPLPTPILRPVHRDPPGVEPQGVLGPEPVERRLRTGQGHGWLLRLDAGDYAHVRIEQLGADVAVALFDPAGRFLSEIDTITPMGHDGEEHLHVQVASRGLYRFEVRAIGDRGDDAAYRAQVAVRRPVTAGDLRRVEAEAVFHRGVALRSAGRLHEALPLMIRAEARFGLLGDQHRQAQAQLGRCAVRYRLGDYRRAAPACESAAAFFRRQGALDLVTALNVLGKIHSNLDDPWSALRALEESSDLVESLGDSWLLAEVHTDLGMAHRQLSEFPLALADLDRALEIWKRLGEDERAAFVLHERGLIYRKLGQLEQATDDFRRSLARRPIGSPRRPLTLIALAMVLVEQGGGSAALEPLEQALASLEEALEIEARIGNRAGIASVLTAMGLVHQQIGRPEEAADRYREALPLARSAGDRELLGSLYFNLAGLAGDRADEAAALLRHALQEYRAAANREAQLTTLLALARAERAQGRLHNGLQHLETARILFLELRQRLPRSDLRISFMAHRWDLFDSAIDLLMALHRQDPNQNHDVRAFEMSEEARGRVLLDLVSGTGTGIGPATPGGEVLSLSEVQRRLLDPATVLLDYKLGDERSYLWVVEHDGLDTFELPPRARLEALARAFHRQLSQPPRHAEAAALERTGASLSRALLCPARDRLLGRQLLVVAEGELLYLPFAALDLSACGDSGGGTEAPLAVEHPIVAGPSASALAALRRRSRPPPERTLTVIADPVFDHCDRRVAGRHRGRGCDGGYPRLLHSGIEAEAILGLVPPGERAAALDFAARRDRLDGLLTGSRFLHFATHTDTTSEPPRLVLSQVDRRGLPLEQSYLTANDVARLSLAADLVVLGGCETGSGRQFRGEGLVGLAHAFFEAGAGGVMATLWPIDDRATAVFMERFYRHLLHGGAAPATALARAQHEMQSKPRWQAPYYWAGFVLLGEGLPSALAGPEPASPGPLAAGGE